MYKCVLNFLVNSNLYRVACYVFVDALFGCLLDYEIQRHTKRTKGKRKRGKVEFHVLYINSFSHHPSD